MNKEYKIAQIGHPILRQPTRIVSEKDLKTSKIQNIIDELIYLMRDFNGAGLAANQIYHSYKICVIEIKNNSRYSFMPEIPLKVLINPKIKILNKFKTFSSFEGCLSVPNIRGRVTRYCEINVDYLDREGKVFSEDVYGVSSIVYQHEIDHLNGTLFTDLIDDNKSIITYENYKDYYIDRYEKEMLELIKKYGS